MGVVFALAGLVAGIWSTVKCQTVYYALIDSFPLQFRDPLNSRYAFHVFALSPSTPLWLQADYIKSMAGVCVALLCVSLTCFAFRRLDAGCLVLIGFVAVAVSTIRSWKTYKENRSRLSVVTRD